MVSGGVITPSIVGVGNEFDTRLVVNRNHITLEIFLEEKELVVITVTERRARFIVEVNEGVFGGEGSGHLFLDDLGAVYGIGVPIEFAFFIPNVLLDADSFRIVVVIHVAIVGPVVGQQSVVPSVFLLPDPTGIAHFIPLYGSPVVFG